MTATLDFIDAFLSDVRHLSLIDADRVRDFVLDLRLLLTPKPAAFDSAGEPLYWADPPTEVNW